MTGPTRNKPLPLAPLSIHPLLESHQKRFSKCLACPLGLQTLLHTKNKRIFYKGPIPCDLLVIGEAPCEAELVTGEAFTGNANDLLHSYLQEVMEKSFRLQLTRKPLRPIVRISKSGKKLKPILRVGFTTSVICPCTESPGGKFRAPKKGETNACSPRLKDLIAFTKPAQFLLVGRTAERAFKALYPKDKHPPFFYVCHPSSIIRQEEAGVIDIKRTKSTLTLLSQELLK